MGIESITFAGHSACLLQTCCGVVAIDPWLEGNPLCPDELKSPKKIDLIVLTHGHADHAGDTVRLATQHNAPVAATYELANILGSEGVPQNQLLPMNKGGTVKWKELSVTLTNAFHSSSYDKADGTTVYAGEACGVVVQAKDSTVYHAGDTCFFSDMEDLGKHFRPDVALFPIGDVFTMGPAEAARAASLVKAKVTIPIHYETFELLTGTAERFKSECQKLDICTEIITPGATLSL
jgi:L-ascorbate metabolism protein UlaG (beta-lactamase superfamily)